MRPEQLMRAAKGAAAALALLVAAAAAHAEPYLMVRAGAKCSDCHTNQTGGGKRTAFTHIHARDILQDLDLLPIPRGARPFTGELHSHVSIGGDLRVRNTTIFQDRPDAAGRVANDTAFRGRALSNDSAVNQFRFYAQADLWPDILTLYTDQDFTGGAVTREAFALLRGVLPWGMYLKAGRLYPAFGLRLQDDTAFVRARTGFTFTNPDDGGEIGIQPGPLFLATSVTNGEPGDKDVLATVNAYGVLDEVPVVRHVVAGASFARQSDRRSAAAFYAGSNLWRFTYLGELDVIDDRTVANIGRRDQLAAYGELNLLLLGWLNLRGTFDFAKISRDQDRTRWGLGAEPFISRFIQPRLWYRVSNGVRSRPDENQDELFFELHLFL